MLNTVIEQIIQNQEIINQTQAKLVKKNKHLLIKLENKLIISETETIFDEILNKILNYSSRGNLSQFDDTFFQKHHKKTLESCNLLLSRNQKLISVNNKMCEKKKLEMQEYIRKLAFENQLCTIKNLELVVEKHQLVEKNLFNYIEYQNIPEHTSTAINSTLERILISLQLAILSKLSLSKNHNLNYLIY